MNYDFDFLKKSSIEDFERENDIEEKLCERHKDIYLLEEGKPTSSCFVAVAIREQDYIKIKDGTKYYLIDEAGIELGYYDHLNDEWFLIGSEHRGFGVPYKLEGTGEKLLTNYIKDPVVGYRDALEDIRKRYKDNTIDFSDDDVIEDVIIMKIHEWVEIDELSATGQMVVKMKRKRTD